MKGSLAHVILKYLSWVQSMYIVHFKVSGAIIHSIVSLPLTIIPIVKINTLKQY